MAQAVATHDRYLTAFHAFEAGPGADAPAWLRRLRQAASERFSQLGFPTARKGNEKYKYTNVASIAEAEFRHPLGPLPDVDEARLRRVAPWHDDWLTLVVLDGRYAPALSSPPPGDGVHVGSLAEAVRVNGSVVEGHLARLATFEDDGFTALNTAFLQHGAFVHLPDGLSLDAPLHLLFVSSDDGESTVSYPRTLIVTGRDSRLTLIESYVSLSAGRDLTNAVTEIVVGEGAEVDHYRLLLESVDAYHVSSTRVHQGQDSTFTSLSFAKGAALGRNDFYVLLDAPGSSCFLNGLYITAGSQHIDNNVNIDHAKPHTTSRLYYKGILDGASKAVFGGIVLVRPGAVKANAHQKDKNLIISDEAEVDSKPSLEIYADDVLCGHGATAGAVAQDALFYMRSRGLDEEAARVLLIKAFASEITDQVRVEPLRHYLEKLVAGVVPHAKGVP